MGFKRWGLVIELNLSKKKRPRKRGLKVYMYNDQMVVKKGGLHAAQRTSLMVIAMRDNIGGLSDSIVELIKLLL